jgi:hypothetical protein
VTILDDKHNKLPKYAQEEIETLQRTIRTLREALKAQQQDIPSKVQWGRLYIPDRAKGYLDDNETLSFQVHQHPDTYIRVRLDGQTLKINGDNGLLIVCESSNCFIVKESPQ